MTALIEIAGKYISPGITVIFLLYSDICASTLHLQINLTKNCLKYNRNETN